MRLPHRSERKVGMLISQNSPRVGLTRKQEIQEGVFLAEALKRVKDGRVMTSFINANENEFEVDESSVKLQKIGLTQEVIQPRVCYANREKAVSNNSG
jgi:hypothetical protein